MKMRRAMILILCCSAAFAKSQPVTIPSVSAALAIDGKLDDAAWRSAQVLNLTSSEFGAPFPAGGETRIATRGDFLCLSARVPEPDRVVAHSFGRNPTWYPEDLVDWTFHVHDAATRRSLNVSLSVNALGAFRLQNASTQEVLDGSDKVLVAVQRTANEWTIEAAIPLDRLAKIGFLTVERTRVSRPVAPELKWWWPGASERAFFQLAELTKEPAPEYRAMAPRAAEAALPGRSSSDLAWIPANAWSAEQREQLHASAALENSLRARLAKVAEEEKLAWQKVDSKQSWERFRDPRIAALRKSLEPFPERTPLRAAVTRRANYGDGFAIENVVFESRPNLLVTANLYLPEKPSGKIPAIVVVHAHHAPKTQSELQDMGMTWARSGTAVLVMDQLSAGERSQTQPWYRESYNGRYALGNQLLVAGDSLMKWMVWDLMRGIDLLLERPYIDPKRIVMLGAVAGGGDPAAVTAALDPRIAASIPFNFGESGPEEHYTLGPRGYDADTAWPGWGEWETTRSLPRSSIDQFFPWLIVVSVAPRPFLFSFEIGWPQTVEQEPIWARYKKVFDLYSARDKLDEVHGFGPFPGPGECTNVGTSLRKDIYPILNRWLQIAVPASEYHNTLPDSELMALTPALVSERKPKTASAIALDVATQRLTAARTKISSGSAAERRRQLRAALQAKLGDIEPTAKPSAQHLWEKTEANVAVEALAIETEPGITLPVLLLKPAGSAAKSPAVIAIAEGGKSRFLAARSGGISGLLKKGVAICLPDLRGMGEAGESDARGPGAMWAASNEFMLGRTLLGSRLKDTRTLVTYLASRPDIDPARIAVWGDSFAETNAADFEFDQSPMQVPGPIPQYQAEPMGALIALLTGLYDDQVTTIAARGGLVSFLSVLEDRFAHIPQDVIVPGVLAAGDVSDIVAAQTAKAVLLEEFVDGRNKIVAKTRLQSEFGPALQSNPSWIARETVAEPGLTAWLADRLSQNSSRP